MERISRRTLLIASVGALLAPAARATARTVPPPQPSPYVPVPIPGSKPPVSTGEINGVTVSAIGFGSHDADSIPVVLHNANRGDKVITITYKDTGPTPSRRPNVVTVPAGQSRSLTIYGHPTRKITLTVTDNAGGSLSLPIIRGRMPRGVTPRPPTSPRARTSTPAKQTANVRSGPRPIGHP